VLKAPIFKGGHTRGARLSGSVWCAWANCVLSVCQLRPVDQEDRSPRFSRLGGEDGSRTECQMSSLSRHERPDPRQARSARARWTVFSSVEIPGRVIGAQGQCGAGDRQIDRWARVRHLYQDATVLGRRAASANREHYINGGQLVSALVDAIQAVARQELGPPDVIPSC